MRHFRPLLLCLILLSLPAHADPMPIITGRVISVADGNTIIVLTSDNQQVRVRLYGIYCPERDQPFGNRARQATAEAVQGETVDVLPIEIDSYGSTVGLVTVGGANGISVNAMLLHKGLAWVYPQYCRWGNVCMSFQKKEIGARENRVGLWSDENPNPPWEWRKQKR